MEKILFTPSNTLVAPMKQKIVLYAKNFLLINELNGIKEYAASHDLHLVIPTMFTIRDIVENWEGDGIITDDDWAVEKLSARGVKIVALSTLDKLLKYADSIIGTDNEKIGCLCADYFLRRGYRNFAVFIDHYGRDEVFKRRIEEHGFSAIPIISHTLLFNFEELTHIGSQLKQLPQPCAIFCNNDWQAFFVLQAAKIENIDVPRQLSVIGVGNASQFGASAGLSSLDSHDYERGCLAAREMDRLLAGGERRSTPILVPPGELIERQSSNQFAVEDPKLRSIINYLQQHAGEPIRLADTARHFNLGESSLLRLFKHFFNQTPKQFLTELRLSNAKRLLRDTKDKIETIAFSCGFSSPTALYELFQKRYQRTPESWRKENRNF